MFFNATCVSDMNSTFQNFYRRKAILRSYTIINRVINHVSASSHPFQTNAQSNVEHQHIDSFGMDWWMSTRSSDLENILSIGTS